MKPRMVTVRYSRTLPYSIAEAYAWLTDYRDDDPQRTRAIQKTRRVISRTDTTVMLEAELEVRGAPIKALVQVKLSPPDHWTATFQEGRLKGSIYNYRLTPAPGGCTLDIDHNIRVTRAKAWLRVMLGRSVLRREIHEMWDGFALAMANEIPAARSIAA